MQATDCHRSRSRADLTAEGGQGGSPNYPVAAEFLTAEGARTHIINTFYSDITTDLTGQLPVTTQSADCPFNGEDIAPRVCWSLQEHYVQI
eukprot:6210719-Pleurochrysis_carterae.AAC.6